jgi:hypothetical protein
MMVADKIRFTVGAGGCRVNMNGEWVLVIAGDYIIHDSEGGISIWGAEMFNGAFIAIPKDEPVNMKAPVDPEEERMVALREHYWSCAKEIKLAYESLTAVGFREDEAFAILMKMMENPIKSPKRSKEDVIREFNKWRSERKATKDVEELVNHVNPRKERANNV